MRNKGPLMLDGYGLQRNNGTLALCIGVEECYEGESLCRNDLQYYRYRMFEDGHFSTLTDTDVNKELSHGSRIIVIQL